MTEEIADGMHASEARLDAADALRRLGHSIVAHDAGDEFFVRVAEAIDRVLPDIEASPPRRRLPEHMKRGLFEGPPPDGERIDHFPDCVISGHANPLGVAIVVHREGEEAVARVTLGPAFEGAPGRAHGGTVAGIFDDVLGNVLTIIEQPAFTAELTVRYLAPTPLGVELEYRGRLVRREGRKLWIEGECSDPEGARIAEASGLFIAIDFTRMGSK
ncbi:MAG: PaaI family thioesterase [Actinobacteria bacterium]|nr:PaaI family thioesterase [Actinomycetota bacterium]